MEKFKLAAELLLRCPYCNELQSSTDTTCNSCQKDFELPSVLQPTEKDPDGAPRFEATEKPGIGISVTPGRVSANRNRRRNDGLKGIVSFAVTFFLPTLLIVGTWHLYGEQLGLPALPWNSKNLSATNDTQTETAFRQLRSAESQRNDSRQKNDPPPKLVSPSIAILGAKITSEQALDQQTSRVLGTQRYVDVRVRNLSQCKINSLDYKVVLRNLQANKAVVKNGTKVFKVPLDPGEERGFDVLIGKSSSYGRATILIESVKSGSQVESTVVKGDFALTSP